MWAPHYLISRFSHLAMKPSNTLPEITKLVDKALELVKDLGVHAITRDVKVVDVLTVLLDQLSLDLFEIKWGHTHTRSTVDTLFTTDNVGSQWFRESTVRLSQVSLEEFDDGRWEVELGSLVNYILLRKVVRDHELGKVTDDLGRRSDLDDITTQGVGFNVLLLDVDPLGTETELGCLELQVGVLTVSSASPPHP